MGINNVSNIRKGGYSVSQNTSGAKKQEEKAETQKQEANNAQASTGSQKDIDITRDYEATLNKVGINFNSIRKSMIDPADYLSAETIAGIQAAMMEDFEPGVINNANKVREELPSGVSEKTINAIAAKMKLAEL